MPTHQVPPYGVALRDQLRIPAGPVVVINTFTVPPDLIEEFLAIWRDDAQFMKSRAGCLDVQLHRGIGGSGVFVNVATWESTPALADAIERPEFAAATAKYSDRITASPQVCTTVAVPGVCAGLPYPGE